MCHFVYRISELEVCDGAVQRSISCTQHASGNLPLYYNIVMTCTPLKLSLRPLLWAAVVLAILGITHPSGAQSPVARRPITVLLVPGLLPSDLSRPECAHLTALIESGSSAWMVCRAAKPADPQDLRKDGRDPLPSLLLTLGAGARARVGNESQKIVAPSAHAFHTQPFPDPAALRNLLLSNSHLDHSVHVGCLGDMLHASGIRTYVAGNLDASSPDRSLFLLAMDRKGTADDAGPRLTKILPDDVSPFGIKTNVAGILTDYDICAPSDRFRIIGLGDLLRADKYSDLARSSVAETQRAEALRTIDSAIAEFSKRTLNEPGGLLVLVSPGPADSTTNPQDRLGFITAAGANIKPGLLTSNSTRRLGLVDITDFVPTVAEWIKKSVPYAINGSPMHTATGDTPTRMAAAMADLHTDLTARADIQNLLGGLPTVQMLVLLIAILIPAGWPRTKLPRSLSLLLISMPLLMLALPACVPAARPASIAALITVSLIIAAIGAVLQSDVMLKRIAIGILGTLLLMTIADLATGSHLMKTAWMSYSATDGSRFYGIGNEYMGAVIGALCGLYALLFSFSSNKHKLKSRIYFALFSVTIAVMFFPLAGAKAGALPSAGSAMLALIWMHPTTSKSTRLRQLCACVACMSAFAAGSIALDRATGATHLAKAASSKAADSRAVVVKRKLANEVRLLTRSPWMPTVIVSLFAVLYLRSRSTGFERVSFNAALVGGTACLLLNDAGVLAAANVFLVSAGTSILFFKPGAAASTPLHPAAGTECPQQPVTTA